MRFLTSYNWPGNVRELEGTIEYVVATCEDKVIKKEHLPLDFFHTDLSKSEALGLSEKLMGKKQEEEFVFLLDIIQQYNDSGKSIGRKILSALSRDFKYNLSEDQIRNRTDMLMEMDLLVKSRGRMGMQISSKGIEFLKNAKKENME
jgi:DNA-binding NtrC family response regulator